MWIKDMTLEQHRIKVAALTELNEYLWKLNDATPEDHPAKYEIDNAAEGSQVGLDDAIADYKTFLKNY